MKEKEKERSLDETNTRSFIRLFAKGQPAKTKAK